jgi:hypothetical protein
MNPCQLNTVVAVCEAKSKLLPTCMDKGYMGADPSLIQLICSKNKNIIIFSDLLQLSMSYVFQ